MQKVGDFIKGRASKSLGKVKPTYLPGVRCADFKKLFDAPIYEALQKGIKLMSNKLKGFDDEDAVLTAVETRSSSPVRIVRDEGYQANIRGLYPIGEGAGYAGGITSASADALKVVFMGVSKSAVK